MDTYSIHLWNLKCIITQKCTTSLFSQLHKEEIETVNIDGTRFIIDGMYLTLPVGVDMAYQSIMPFRKKNILGCQKLLFLPNTSQF